MLRFVVLSTFVAFVTAAGGYGGSQSASGYGGSKGGSSMSAGYGGMGLDRMRSSGSAYGGSKGSMGSSSMGGSYDNMGMEGMRSSGSGYGSMNGGYGGGEGEVVQAAIQTTHNIEYRDVPSMGMVKPTTIEVGANSIPLNIVFRSASSNLNIQQQHESAQGSTQETSSEDEPHRLVHSVKKPIIQEVREIITPMRKITQEIKPVQEEILTIVSRNEEKDKGYGGSMDGGYGAGASGASEKSIGGNGYAADKPSMSMGGYGGEKAQMSMSHVPKKQMGGYGSATGMSMSMGGGRKGY